jgi:hypothetical protein
MARPDVETDSAAISQAIWDNVAARFPGWIARDGNLEVWLTEEYSTVAAEIRQEAITVPEAIYQAYGEEVLGIPALAPQTATGLSTWVATDTGGYTIPAGTQLTLAASGSDLIPFEVVTTAVIPIGETVLTDVLIHATSAGQTANGLSGPAELVDPLPWVSSVQVDVPTRDGADGQTIDQYLSELILLMRLIALRPILPLDYAILALTRVPGVARAVAMDGYDPADGTWGHQRMVTLILTDADGEPCTVEVKNAVRQLLESLREVNFIVHVIDANYLTIDVGYTLTTFAEQDGPTVQGICDEAVATALSPATFRLGSASPSIAGGELMPPPDAGEVPSRQILRMNDLVALLDRQRGVDWVGTVALQGAAADYTMPDAITLPRPGGISGTVNVPAYREPA